MPDENVTTTKKPIPITKPPTVRHSIYKVILIQLVALVVYIIFSYLVLFYLTSAERGDFTPQIVGPASFVGLPHIYDLVFYLLILSLGVLVTKYSKLRNIVLFAGSPFGVLFSVLTLLVFLQSCEGVGCIGQGFFYRLNILYWMTLSSILPIIIVSRSNKHISLNFYKRFFIAEIVSLLLFLVLGLGPISPGIIEKRNATIKQQQNTESYTTDYGYYKPSFLPTTFKGKYKENILTDERFITTHYGCGEITQIGFVNQPITSKPGFLAENPSDFEKYLIKENQNFKPGVYEYKINYEHITVNDFPGFYLEDISPNYQKPTSRSVVFFTPKSKIEIKILGEPISECTTITKDELIKIAESMKTS